MRFFNPKAFAYGAVGGALSIPLVHFAAKHHQASQRRAAEAREEAETAARAEKSFETERARRNALTEVSLKLLDCRGTLAESAARPGFCDRQAKDDSKVMSADCRAAYQRLWEASKKCTEAYDKETARIEAEFAEKTPKM